MERIKNFMQFEGFSMKGIGGKKIVYCHSCSHTFNEPKPSSRKIICPSCAALGFLNRGLSYLRPIERKF